MKKNLFALLGRKVIMVSIAACTLMIPAGCGGGGGGTTNPLTAIPDVSNFLLQASTAFVAGEQALIHVASSSLGNGTFTVNFSLSGSNTGSGSAALTMSGGVGTFTTPAPLTSGGPTTVTISSITNSAGGSAAPTSGNISSMFDSTGTMVATYTPHGGAAVAFNATDVTASVTGTLLNIQGVVWQPNLTTINLNNEVYHGATGTDAFNFYDDVPSDPTSTFNGNASYGVAGSGGTSSELSVHGSITLNTVSPLLTGSFTYTNADSSVVAGTFSCPAP